MSAPYGLTPLQARTLKVIRRHVRKDGLAPTYEQIAAELGLKAKSQIARLVYALERRGHISRLPHQRQSIRLTEPVAPRPATAPREALQGRPVEKRCTEPACNASYVTTFTNQERCWNCQVRALQSARTPAWPVENAR